jgi:hypothetical protein
MARSRATVNGPIDSARAPAPAGPAREAVLVAQDERAVADLDLDRDDRGLSPTAIC